MNVSDGTALLDRIAQAVVARIDKSDRLILKDQPRRAPYAAQRANGGSQAPVDGRLAPAAYWFKEEK
jgi:hypothetical protein